MRAGVLRYVISILQKGTLKSAFGDVKADYTPYKTIKAALVTQTGNKIIENSELFNVKQKEFQIRYDSNITEDMRISYNNADYKILSISEIGFRSGLSIKIELING